MMWKMRAAALAAGFAAVLSGCGPNMGVINAYCDELEGCSYRSMDVLQDKDDAVRVCAASHAGTIKTLLANSEKECVDLAAAKQALWACIADNRDCEEINQGDECDKERDDVEDAREAAGSLCNAE